MPAFLRRHLRVLALFPIATLSVELLARGPNFSDVSTEQELYLDYRLEEQSSSLSDSDRISSESGELSLSKSYSGNDDEGDPWSLEATATLTQSISEVTTSDRLTANGALRSELSLSQTNVDSTLPSYLNATNEVDPQILRRGNRVDLYFTSEYYLNYDFELTFLENSGCEAQIFLMKARWYIDSTGNEVYGYLPFGEDSWAQEGLVADLDLEGDVKQGDYLLRVLLLATDNDVGEASFDFTANIDFNDPLLLDYPTGGHTHPNIGTEIDDPSNLSFSDLQITSETDNGDETTDILVAARISNSGSKSWSDVRLHLADRAENAPAIEERGYFEFELDPSETIEASEGSVLEVRVANSDLDAVRVELLSTDTYRLSGRRLNGFRYPPYPFTNGIPTTVEVDGETVYLMTTDTLFSSEDFDRATLLVANEPIYEEVEIAGFPILYNPFAGKIPFLITNVPPSDASAGTDYYRGKVTPLHELLVDGRVETTILPAQQYYPGGGSADATGPDTGGEFPDRSPGYPVPMIKNQLNLNEWVTFSGSYYLRPGTFAMAIEKNEDSDDMEFTVRGEMVLDTNLLLEITAPINNTSEPLAESEQRLFKFNLFSVALPNGFILKPEFAMYIRAGIDANASLSIPFDTQIKLTFEGGVRNGDPVLTSNAEIVELPVTNLTIQDDISASVYIENEFETFLALYPPDGGLSGNAIGPTFSAHAGIEFNVDTTASPLYTVEADLELRAGIDIRLNDEVSEVFDIDITIPEATLKTLPLFSFEYDPASSETSSISTHSVTTLNETTPTQPGLLPLHGADLRWARILSPLPVDRASDFHFIIPLEGSDDYIVGDGATFSRLTKEGALLWTRQHVLFTPIAAVAEPDGGFTVLSNRTNRIEIARYDANGDPVWQKAHTTEANLGFLCFDLARRNVEENASEYFVLNRVNFIGSQNRLPGVARIDDTGALDWFEVYELDNPSPNTEPRRLTFSSDGKLVLCGITDADIDTDSLSINITKNLFAAKIDPDNASVVWSNAYGSLRSPTISSIESDDTGRAYLGGYIGVVVGDPYPSTLLYQIDEYGNHSDGILFGPADENLSTPYDTINDIAWLNGDLWVAGRIGASSGITDTASAFTARITDRFAVTRMSLFAGPEDDAFHALTPASNDSGIIAIGSAEALLPWPNGDPTARSRLIVKLPWEGIIRFHPLSAGAQDPALLDSFKAGTQFIEPRIQTIAALDEVFDGQTAIPLIRQTIAFQESTSTFPPDFISPNQFIALESVPRGSYDYITWAQIEPDSDTDGDLLSNEQELEWGSNPFDAQDTPLVSMQLVAGESTQTYILTLRRASDAGTIVPKLESSTNLLEWQPYDNFTYTLNSKDAAYDELRLEVPATSLAEAKFLRLLLSE